MMRLVESPQVPIPVLPAVHPVDVEVVRDDEERHLEPDWPMREPLEPREATDSVERRDDDREDDDAEHVILCDRVQSEVVEEPFPKKRLALVVRHDPLEPRQED